MSLKSLVFAAVLLAVPLTQTHAALIKAEFSGSVTIVSGSASGGSGFAAGQSATYEFVFDDQAPPLRSGADPVLGGTFSTYLNSFLSFEGRIGSYAFSGNGGYATIKNDVNETGFFPDIGVRDTISLQHLDSDVYEGALNVFGRTDFETGAEVNGLPLKYVNVSLTDVTSSLLNNSMLWQENFEAFQTISDFADANRFNLFFLPTAFGVVDILVEGSFDTMTLTNLSIPVSAPSALLLLCFGVGLIRASRKK